MANIHMESGRRFLATLPQKRQIIPAMEQAGQTTKKLGDLHAVAESKLHIIVKQA